MIIRDFILEEKLVIEKNLTSKREIIPTKLSKYEKRLFKVLLITQENRKKSDSLWESNKNS